MSVGAAGPADGLAVDLLVAALLLCCLSAVAAFFCFVVAVLLFCVLFVSLGTTNGRPRPDVAREHSEQPVTAYCSLLLLIIWCCCVLVCLPQVVVQHS